MWSEVGGLIWGYGIGIVMKHVLITGFEPFDGSCLNPSAEVARRLNGQEIGDKKVTGGVLPLDYRTMMSFFRQHVREVHPEFILLMDQSNRGSVTIERMAVNSVSTEKEDNEGYAPESDLISPPGPVGYFSNVDVSVLARTLRDKGFSVFVSYHAGTFGCNYIFYKVLDLVARGDLKAKVLFIHVPPLPAQAIEKHDQSLPTIELDDLVEVVRAIIREF
jgi:pyroglutamyl-peptidase